MDTFYHSKAPSMDAHNHTDWFGTNTSPDLPHPPADFSNYAYPATRTVEGKRCHHGATNEQFGEHRKAIYWLDCHHETSFDFFSFEANGASPLDEACGQLIEFRQLQ